MTGRGSEVLQTALIFWGEKTSRDGGPGLRPGREAIIFITHRAAAGLLEAVAMPHAACPACRQPSRLSRASRSPGYLVPYPAPGPLVRHRGRPSHRAGNLPAGRHRLARSLSVRARRLWWCLADGETRPQASKQARTRTRTRAPTHTRSRETLTLREMCLPPGRFWMPAKMELGGETRPWEMGRPLEMWRWDGQAAVPASTCPDRAGHAAAHLAGLASESRWN